MPRVLVRHQLVANLAEAAVGTGTNHMERAPARVAAVAKNLIQCQLAAKSAVGPELMPRVLVHHQLVAKLTKAALGTKTNHMERARARVAAVAKSLTQCQLAAKDAVEPKLMPRALVGHQLIAKLAQDAVGTRTNHMERAPARVAAVAKSLTQCQFAAKPYWEARVVRGQCAGRGAVVVAENQDH